MSGGLGYRQVSQVYHHRKLWGRVLQEARPDVTGG